MYVCVCTCVYVCFYEYMYACMYVCMCVFVHVCMYISMNICMYVSSHLVKLNIINPTFSSPYRSNSGMCPPIQPVTNSHRAPDIFLNSCP